MSQPKSNVLRHPELAQRFDRDGYVVVDFLAAAEAQDLRTEYGELHGWEPKHFSSDQPPDFESDFWNIDLGYRRAICDAIHQAVVPGLQRYLPDLVPLGGSFLVRWPSDPSVPEWTDVPNRFHNDSMFIDERTGARSYMVWIALQDITLTDGAMVVVPSSHKLDRTIRGIDFEAPWLQFVDVFEARSKTIGMSTGQAIIMDPSLIHRSGSNRTATPRVIASLLAVPPGASLSYFRQTGTGAAERVAIEPDFFLRAQMSEMGSLPACETLPIHHAEYSPSTIASQLDRQTRRAFWPFRRSALKGERY